ncbi:MAG: hypothetical protein KGJ32_07800 [Xanthomonadaceae bacterium]|nr:hypothetical protein [Xanthomonadaceae bacterium]
MPALPRLILATAIASLALTGCADRSATRASTVAANSRPPAAAAGRTHHPHRPAINLPDRTGIAACDDYLSSYIACHRAAGIFTPDQLPERYQTMRNSLLRDSLNPDMRPQLATRCNSLARQLREALHGKSCEVNPAPASSAP